LLCLLVTLAPSLIQLCQWDRHRGELWQFMCTFRQE
jgi:hypothetical protein